MFNTPLRTGLAVLVMAFFMVQCTQTEPEQEEVIPSSDEGDVDDFAESPAEVDPLSEVPEFPADEVAAFDGGSPVYFAYDDYQVTAEAANSFEPLVTWLKENPGASLTIEGHADDRGTVEYNLALGEKRANSVKTYLVDKGVDGARLETVSYGEERPAVVGSDEFAWSQNRRVEFVTKNNPVPDGSSSDFSSDDLGM